jgi:hypothetical protein
MIVWRKSSRSGIQDGSECVEIAAMPGRTARVIGVRDSKQPDGPKLYLTRGQWSTLLTAIKTDT